MLMGPLELLGVHQAPQPTGLVSPADLTGKPVCVVRDEFSLAPVTQPALLSSCLMGMPTISVPIGDPQSNRNPQLPPGEYSGHILLSEGSFFSQSLWLGRGHCSSMGLPFCVVPQALTPWI